MINAAVTAILKYFIVSLIEKNKFLPFSIELKLNGRRINVTRLCLSQFSSQQESNFYINLINNLRPSFVLSLLKLKT